VVTSYDAIFLASGDIKRHMSMGLFPLTIYLQVPRYLTNYPIRYPGNKLPGYGSPSHGNVWVLENCITTTTTTTTTKYYIRLMALLPGQPG